MIRDMDRVKLLKIDNALQSPDLKCWAETGASTALGEEGAAWRVTQG